jgi:hypothetical protein
MRVVEYNGVAVKRQRKIGANEILLVFYDQPPLVVSSKDWEKYSQNRYYNDGVKRSEVVRRAVATH